MEAGGMKYINKTHNNMQLDSIKSLMLDKSKSIKLLNRLYYNNLNSPLIEGYRHSYLCCRTITVENNKVITQYCKNRWCLVCSKMLGKEVFNKYYPVFNKCDNVYLLTLSRPNTEAVNLISEVELITTTIRKVLQSRTIREYLKSGVIGLKKIEITFNEKENTYHPHLHILISDYNAAKEIKQLWLKHNQVSKAAAQNLIKCNKEDIQHVLNYITKLCYKVNDNNLYNFVNPIALDTIFRALKGKKIFTKIGNYKVAQPQKEDNDINLIEDNSKNGIYSFSLIGDSLCYSSEDGNVLATIPRPSYIE